MSDNATTLHVTISTTSNIPTPVSHLGKREKRRRLESSNSSHSISSAEPPMNYGNPPLGPRRQNEPITSLIKPPLLPYTEPITSNTKPLSLPSSSNSYSQAPVSIPFPLHSGNPSRIPATLGVRRPRSNIIRPNPTPHPFSRSIKPPSSRDRLIRDLRQRLAAKVAESVAKQDRHQKEITALKVQHGREKESQATMRTQAECRAFVAEKKAGEANMRKAVVEGILRRAEEGSRVQIAAATARSTRLDDQLRLATDRGKRWVKRSGELEAKLGESRVEVEREKKRANQAEDQLESILCETTTLGGSATTSLRQHLLTAKSELAQERLTVQDLRRQITRFTDELATRATTILNLTSTIKQRDANLATAQSRISELDKECESQLSELQNQLGLVANLTTEVANAQIANASQLSSQADLLIELVKAQSELAKAQDRAEWYKSEHKRAEVEVTRRREETARQRQLTDHFKSRALLPRSNFDTKAKRSYPNQLYKPRWQIKREASIVRVKSEESSVEGVETILPLAEEVLGENIGVSVRSYQEQTPEERLVAAQLWAQMLAGNSSVLETNLTVPVPAVSQNDIPLVVVVTRGTGGEGSDDLVSSE